MLCVTQLMPRRFQFCQSRFDTLSLFPAQNLMTTLSSKDYQATPTTLSFQTALSNSTHEISSSNEQDPKMHLQNAFQSESAPDISYLKYQWAYSFKQPLASLRFHFSAYFFSPSSRKVFVLDQTINSLYRRRKSSSA